MERGERESRVRLVCDSERRKGSRERGTKTERKKARTRESEGAAEPKAAAGVREQRVRITKSE